MLSPSLVSDADLDLMMLMSIGQAEIEGGVHPTRVARTSGLSVSVFSGTAVQKASKAPEWTPDDIAFIKYNYDKMTTAQMSDALGRSPIAVKVRLKRFGLPQLSTSKNFYLTANVVSHMLGLDAHKICYWFDQGFLPGFVQPGGRRIRLISRKALTAWTINPLNWIYFDWHNICDPKLRRLCELRAERWNDEWWTTKQVAAYHGVTTGDIKRFIQTRRIDATQVRFSLGGRHHDPRWLNWFIRKSEATRPDLNFWTRANPRPALTPRAEAWILYARDVLGMNWTHIGLRMGSTWRRKRDAGHGIDGCTVKKYYEIAKDHQ